MLQPLLDGIATAALYGLLALGFSLVYSTTRVFHFAHGAIFALAGYGVFLFHVQMGAPLAVGLLVAVTCATTIGVLTDKLVYKPLATQGSSATVLLMSSLGLYIFLVNGLALAFGSESKLLSWSADQALEFGPASMTRLQIVTVVSFGLVAAGSVLLMHRTHVGRQLRALQDNALLLSALGTDARPLRTTVFAYASVLAAIAGSLRALDVGLDPHMGMAVLLPAVVAMIVGGVSRLEGVAVGAIILGVLENVAVWHWSARWEPLVTFTLLIGFLLLRPRGLFQNGRRVEQQ